MMTLAVVFVVVWWKLDFWWALAAALTVNALTPWHYSHFRTTEHKGEEPKGGNG